MKSKKGQFYILAAVIIISVIVGFAVVKNYAKAEKEKTKVYDLGEELKLETGRVYDYGIYNQTDIDTLISDWSKKYIDYSEKYGVIEDWVFVYGEKKNLHALVFRLEETGGIGLQTGTGSSKIITKERFKEPVPFSIGKDNKVTVKFENFDHTFQLQEGENFFFVIKSKGYVGE